MTVSAAMVSMVDRGFILTESDATYLQLKAWAKEQLDLENPGLSTATYDRCHALLIAHMYEIGDPTAGYKSYSTAEFSASQEPGQTIWILEYKQIIEAFISVDTSGESSVTRADADMPEFHLDQSSVPSYYLEA